MKRNVSFILVFLCWILLNPVNVFSQTTIIYQTGFENIPDSTMLGTTLSAANDGWRVNSNAVQKTEASQLNCFSGLRPKEEFRNAWTVTNAWHWQHLTPNQNTPRAQGIEPIDNQTLCICGYWGATGTTDYETKTCQSGLDTNRVNGVMQYFTDLAANRWAYRVIPTTGYTSITLQFKWRCNGKTSNEQDYGQVGYSLDGGTTWTWLATHYQGQTTVNQTAIISLPAACNNQSNLAIGFGFVCAGLGTDQDINEGFPGFAIDDMVVQGIAKSCKGVTITTQPVNVTICSPGDTASFSITAKGDEPISYQWQVGPAWNNISYINPINRGDTTSILKVSIPTDTLLQYRCIASNCSPVVYATSNAATLTVSYLTANITPSGPTTFCDGGSVQLKANTGTGLIYQWMNDGVNIPGQTSGSYKATKQGNYTVIVTENSCNATSNNVLVRLNYPPQIPIIISTGTLIYCVGGSVTLTDTSSATAISYLWSNGDTTKTIIVTTPGIYTVMVTDNNGCTSQSYPFMVGSSPISSPAICIVTVDDVIGKNEVVWNRPISKAIDHFNVYSQGAQANVFNLIGKVPWDSLTVFIDTSSIPAQQSYLYQISAVDTCKSESQLSAVHQTIHLSINQGTSDTWNLIWNFYEGFTFASYNIYRGTSPSNMTLLYTIASNLNSYTDLNPPTGLIYYQIEALNPNPCNPTRAKSNDYGSTKSNVATNNSEYSVVNYNRGNAGINIYPNPANDIITIDFQGYTGKDKTMIGLYSITGELIKQATVNSQQSTENKFQLNVADLAKGVYVIKVINDKIVEVKRVIKK